MQASKNDYVCLAKLSKNNIFWLKVCIATECLPNGFGHDILMYNLEIIQISLVWFYVVQFDAFFLPGNLLVVATSVTSFNSSSSSRRLVLHGAEQLKASILNSNILPSNSNLQFVLNASKKN